ncbi:MAG: hypothetical protein RL557_645 [archaeon]
MGKYTIYDGKIDDYLEKHYFNKIVESFKQDVAAMNHTLIAIILFGGFGKGEGSVQIIDGRPVPYNDFDFYIVTERKLSEEQLDVISHHASEAIGMGGLEVAYFPTDQYDSKKFFHVDVRCIPFPSLKTLMKTQRYYELKYKSIIIDGDATVLGEIPAIQPEDISLSEGLRNLFNKLHTMLLGLREEYTEEQKKIKIFWSYKTYLSIAESLLILDRKFAPSAFERNKLFYDIYDTDFPDLHAHIPSLPLKVNKATQFKLKLDFRVDHERLWKESLSDILTVFEYYIKNISESKTVAEALKNKLPYTYFKPYLQEKIGFNFFPAQYLLNVGYAQVLMKKDSLFIRPLFQWRDVGLKIILPLYYLLKYQLEQHEERRAYFLERAYKELKCVISVEKKEFWHLRERALKAFGMYYQQRLL